MNRDKVREILASSGIKCETVTDEELNNLRKILAKHLRESAIYRGTARIVRAKKDLKFIEMKTDQWECREAISFNRDGFIGIAGWADNNNVQPILSALIDWANNSNQSGN